MSTLLEKEKALPRWEQKTIKQQRFQFASYILAFQVREVVYMKVIAFDANNDEQFQEQEIRQFLETVLQQTQPEIHYFVKNVFRYDYNNDGIIEYDELVNFCMEQHFGEIAIQRLHKKKTYKQGSKRIMDQQEFMKTIKYALSYIDFVPPEEEVNLCFQTVDADQDGWISYEDYFRFLKEYFGSKSMAATLVNKKSVIEELKLSGDIRKELNIIKRYSKYEGKENNGNTIKPGYINMTAKKENPANISGLTNISNISSLNNSLTDNNTSFNSTDKKNKPIPNPKLQLTILNKHKNEQKAQISFTQAESALTDKIARLVYLQVLAALTYYDHDQDCNLIADNIFTFMKDIFQYRPDSEAEVTKRCNLSKQKLYTYEEATKIVINQNIFRVCREKKEDNKTISQAEFLQLSEQICGVARNTPLWMKYESLYKLRNEKGSVAVTDVQNLFQFIFNNYPKK